MALSKIKTYVNDEVSITVKYTSSTKKWSATSVGLSNYSVYQEVETNSDYKNDYYVVFRTSTVLISLAENLSTDDSIFSVNLASFAVATVTYSYPLAVPTEDTPSYIAKLNSRITALEAENTTLKAQLATLTPKYPWQKFYQGFTKRIEFDGCYEISGYVWLDYYIEEFIKTMDITIVEGEETFLLNSEYLFIFNDNKLDTHFIRVVPSEGIAYLDEIHGGNKTSNLDDETYRFEVDFALEKEYPIRTKFNYVFKKVA